jgi:invasion protein IalB
MFNEVFLVKNISITTMKKLKLIALLAVAVMAVYNLKTVSGTGSDLTVNLQTADALRAKAASKIQSTGTLTSTYQDGQYTCTEKESYIDNSCEGVGNIDCTASHVITDYSGPDCKFTP